jgi:hypothetical protein
VPEHYGQNPVELNRGDLSLWSWDAAVSAIIAAEGRPSTNFAIVIRIDAKEAAASATLSRSEPDRFGAALVLLPIREVPDREPCRR